MWRSVLLVTTTFAALFATGVASAGGQDDRTFMPVRIESPMTRETTTVEVKPGDHLWGISATALSERTRREPSDKEVTPLWRAVIDANIAHLRSGDPDLIYPGELVRIPVSVRG
jgi:nucleoid-associated protein YgaU